MIRVLVIDDQMLVRRGFAVMLSLADGIDVLGEGSNGIEAVTLARELRPDVVIMDVRMPEMDGLEATRLIAHDPRSAACRVLILTTFDLDEYVYEALRSGASGFLLKDTKPEDLVNAVRVIADGEALLAPRITRRLIDEFASRPKTIVGSAALSELTERELEVLGAVAAGRSNAEIGAALHMSNGTVKTHVSHLLTKLECRDRVQLAIAAYELGLAIPGARS